VTLRSTAYHEAGHAVVRYKLGLSVKAVSIVSDDNSGGRSSHRPPGEWFRPDIETDARHRRRIEDEVMCGWAGALAEERLGESSDKELEVGAAQDVNTIVWFASYFTGSDYETEAYIEWLRRRTEGLLNRADVWPAIEAVAAALLEEHTLTGRQVRRIIDDAMEAFFAAGKDDDE
jgi:ATP-dependent Zn protease